MSSEPEYHAEKSPLLIQQRSTFTEGGGESNNRGPVRNDRQRGTAGMAQTVVNLSKTCAGTGCLALPYACQEGGWVIFVFGLLAVAVWNVYGVQRLILCLKLIEHEHQESDDDTYGNIQEEIPTGGALPTRQSRFKNLPPPSTASTLGKVAWVALGGPRGLLFMDLMLVILLLGIIISYISGCISFLSDTPLTGGPFWDATVVAILMTMLSLVPDLGYLSNASAVGLIVLAGTFGVISAYGVLGNPKGDPERIPLFPGSIAALSRFFGVIAFGYGVVPLTYNFQSSMQEPHRMVEATFSALCLVATGYCVIGTGLLMLFSQVDGEILHELPSSGLVPTATRLAMASVCIMTAPLIIVPTGELLENKFEVTNQLYQRLVRGGVCLVSAVVAVLLPTFVQVLSFVGCFCVGLTSFCVPPILHLRLRLLLSGDHPSMLALLESQPHLSVDVFMFALGLIATFVGTFFTIR